MRFDDDLPVLSASRNAELLPYGSSLTGPMVVPSCVQCGQLVWYPRGFCPSCGSRKLSPVPMSGRGIVYTYSIVRKDDWEYEHYTPYVIAYVELEEGPRIFTNIVSVDEDSLCCGMRVEAVFQQGADGTSVVRFRPATGGSEAGSAIGT